MKFEIQKAQDAEILLRMFLAGVSESGKSLTALLAAQALGGKCVVIDSENHSVRRYARDFKDWSFDVLSLPNFEPDTYCDAISHCVDTGYNVVVVDSLTPLWSSAGGLAEQAEEHAANNKGTIALGWNKAKNTAKRAVADFAKAQAHIIYTMRAAGVYTREGGKFVQVGERLDFAKDVEYEFNAKGWMDRDHKLNLSIRGMKTPVDITEPTVDDFRRLFTEFQMGKPTNYFADLSNLISLATKDKIDSVKATLTENKRYLNKEQIAKLGAALVAKTKELG